MKRQKYFEKLLKLKQITKHEYNFLITLIPKPFILQCNFGKPFYSKDTTDISNSTSVLSHTIIKQTT